jgi:MoaA/NifB/PqqE/SkfB family radical SAM enzyme
VLDLNTALRLAAMQGGERALIGPQVAQLDLTDACTNNCLGCWARSPLLKDEDRYDTLEKGALDLPFVRQLLPILRGLRVEELFLGGGGDPLCHPDVIAVVRAAKALGFYVTLNTNFTLADERLIEELIAAGLDLAIVSVWAGTGPTYARLHPNKTEAAFEHLTAMLRRLAEAKQKSGRTAPRVKLYDVICALNLEEIPLMYEHARAVEADEMEFAVLDPIPRRTDVFTLDARQIERALELAAALPSDGRPFAHRTLFARRLRNVDAVKGSFDNGIVASIPCAAGWFYSRVTTVGQVHACLKAHRFPVGDLRQHDYRAVWCGGGMAEFRRHTRRLDVNDPWLRIIGHDIGFALPGCFRICDNLGHNQRVMEIAGGLSPDERETIDAMAAAAQQGAELSAIEDIFRARFAPQSPEAAQPFSPPVEIVGEPGLVLHGDIDLIHELGKGARPWNKVVDELGNLGADVPIRVPVTMRNVARLDCLFALIRERTGRAVDPAWVKLEPRPLDDIHCRWPALIARAKGLARPLGVELDFAGEEWPNALWRVAQASRPDNEAELLRALGAATGRAFVGPRTFHLDVANACGSDCVYCWFHSPLAAARDDPYRLTEQNRAAMMDFAMFEALADDLAALEAKEDVVLSGKGDPLTHPRLIDMLRGLRERGLRTTLFTGGLRLDEPIVRACLEAKVAMLYVSLSAASEATFAKLRTGAPREAFGRISGAVKRLIEMRRAAKQEQPRVVLVDVITSRNDGEVADFARQAASLGVDHVRYQLAAIESYNAELALPPERLAALPAALAEARRILETAGATIVDNIDFQTGGHGEGADWTGDRYRRLGCLAGWVFARAWADGELSFCCAPRPIGNLSARRFRDWWASDEYDRLRLAARRLGDHPDFALADGAPLWSDVCRRCPNYEGIERLRRVLTDLDLLRMLP